MSYRHRAKQIVYVLECIVGVCVDPFFLYIPFLSHTKMCLGMNTNLWKVAVALRTVADFFTALILIMSIDRPQLSRCMSSIKLILLMCVKYLVFAPIPQVNNRTINLWAFLFKNCNFLLWYFRFYFPRSSFWKLWEDTRFGIWAFSVSTE